MELIHEDEHAAFEAAHEGKWTKKARLRLAKISKMEHEIHLARVRASNLEMERIAEMKALHVELTEMKRAGEPDNGWARHWRALMPPTELYPK